MLGLRNALDCRGMNMALQLHLTNKETGETVDLIDLDYEICQFLGVRVDPVKWCHGWMDTVGFTLAAGGTRDKLEGYNKDEILFRIWDFIEARYKNESYFTR